MKRAATVAIILFVLIVVIIFPCGAVTANTASEPANAQVMSFHHRGPHYYNFDFKFKGASNSYSSQTFKVESKGTFNINVKVSGLKGKIQVEIDGSYLMQVWGDDDEYLRQIALRPGTHTIGIRALYDDASGNIAIKTDIPYPQRHDEGHNHHDHHDRHGHHRH